MSRCKCCNNIISCDTFYVEYHNKLLPDHLLCEDCYSLGDQQFMYTEEHSYVLEDESFSSKTEILYE